MIQTSAYFNNAPRSKIHLNFQGYWRDCSRSGIPRRPGVFCVYRCRVNEEQGTLSAIQLLYIGQAVNAREAIQRHSRRKQWISHLQKNEELGFSFAPAILDRHAAVLALVKCHDPICNSGEEPALEAADPRYPRQPTSILLSGRIQLLNYSFTAFDQREFSLKTASPSTPPPRGRFVKLGGSLNDGITLPRNDPWQWARSPFTPIDEQPQSLLCGAHERE